MAYRIVMLGEYQSGKSRAGNTFLGRKDFRWSPTCNTNSGNVAGIDVKVVEAPGWILKRPYQSVPEFDIAAFKRSVSSWSAPGPHAVLLTVPVLLVKFPKERKDEIEKHMKILENMKAYGSDSLWDHTILLFTFGDRLGGRRIEQCIRDGGEHLQWLVDKCGDRYHVFNNLEEHGPQATHLMEKIDRMVARNAGAYWFSGEM